MSEQLPEKQAETAQSQQSSVDVGELKLPNGQNTPPSSAPLQHATPVQASPVASGNSGNDLHIATEHGASWKDWSVQKLMLIKQSVLEQIGTSKSSTDKVCSAVFISNSYGQDYIEITYISSKVLEDRINQLRDIQETFRTLVLLSNSLAFHLFEIAEASLSFELLV